MPKIPKPIVPPSMPSSASFISRGTSESTGMGQRPNLIQSPITGGSRLAASMPSLLGGM